MILKLRKPSYELRSYWLITKEAEICRFSRQNFGQKSERDEFQHQS